MFVYVTHMILIAAPAPWILDTGHTTRGCRAMLLASLLLGLLAPAAAVFRGRPGLYTRLFDISPLCPHISFAQPAASTPAEDSILLLQVASAQWRQC